MKRISCIVGAVLASACGSPSTQSTTFDAKTNFTVAISSSETMATVSVSFQRSDALNAPEVEVSEIVRVNGVVLGPSNDTFMVHGGLTVDRGRAYNALIPTAADGKYVLEVGSHSATAVAEPVVFAAEPGVIRTGRVTLTWAPDIVVDESTLEIVGCDDRHLIASTPRSATFDVAYPWGTCTDPNGYLWFRDERSTPLVGDLRGQISISRETRRPVTFAR